MYLPAPTTNGSVGDLLVNGQVPSPHRTVHVCQLKEKENEKIIRSSALPDFTV